MSLLYALRHRLRVVLHPAAYERELNEEMRFHLELDEVQERHDGRTAAAAHDAARRRFGNVTYLQEETRRMAGLDTLDTIRQDVRYAARAFLRAPAFTIAVTLTLALGVGATTAVFSVIDGVLLRGLPFRDPARLLTAFETSDDGGQRLPSYPTFKDWQAQRAAWDGAVDGMAFIRGSDASLRGENGPERVLGGFVTPGFFGLMGTPPLLGRTFLLDEEQHGANHVVVLSYDLWTQRFGGDPAIVGKTIDLGGAPTTVVGVMPRSFTYPTWAAVWQPIAVAEGTDSALIKRGVHSDSRTVIRIRSGVDSARAVVALRTVAQRLATAYPDEQGHFGNVTLRPLRDELLGNVAPTLVALGGAVLLVLLLACANVANLALVRAASRDRELAVRGALGAGRGRIVRQLLTESGALAAVGGGLGVALAMYLVGLVRRHGTAQLPRAAELSVDGRVLLFALAATALAALAAGLFPALRAARPALVERLRSGVLGSVGGVRDTRLRGTLVATQFALALMLLVAAGLLIQSFRRLQAVSLGFEPAGRVAIALFPPGDRYATPAASAALYARLLDRVRAVPGVREVGVVNHVPVRGGWVTSPVRVAGRPTDAKREPEVLYRTASTGYLRAIGMRVVRGRWFTDDDMRSPNGFVVNETMAKQLWPNGDALGQSITLRRSSQAREDFGQPITGEVIGVLGDVRQFGRETPPTPEVYVPYTLEVWPWITLVAQVQSPERAIPALRRAVRDVEPNIPVAGENLQGGFVTVDRLLATATAEAQRRFTLSLVGAFAFVALLLAAIGMYGVIAYGLTQRTRELGIRMALGATQRTIVRLVLGEGVKLAAIGAVVGVVGALAGARVIRALLYDTVPTDATTFVATTALLAAVALVASYIPARRAARLDPTIAIRGE